MIFVGADDGSTGHIPEGWRRYEGAVYRSPVDRIDRTIHISRAGMIEFAVALRAGWKPSWRQQATTAQ